VQKEYFEHILLWKEPSKRLRQAIPSSLNSQHLPSLSATISLNIEFDITSVKKPPKHPFDTRDRSNYTMTGRDEKGVPMLHWRPDHHFERLVAFLAWRNEFIEDVPDKAARKGRNIIERIRPMYAARVHLTPATSIERLGNVLGSLLRSGHFRPNSQLRRAFANISDEQIMTRDASR
jgi:hypothetical protein